MLVEVVPGDFATFKNLVCTHLEELCISILELTGCGLGDCDDISVRYLSRGDSEFET